MVCYRGRCSEEVGRDQASNATITLNVFTFPSHTENTSGSRGFCGRQVWTHFPVRCSRFRSKSLELHRNTSQTLEESARIRHGLSSLVGFARQSEISDLGTLQSMTPQ